MAAEKNYFQSLPRDSRLGAKVSSAHFRARSTSDLAPFILRLPFSAAGLDAALLAARGFTANPDTSEAEHGFAEAFFNPDNDTVALTHRGEPLRIVNPGDASKSSRASTPCASRFSSPWKHGEES
jgi:hypothetical protein